MVSWEVLLPGEKSVHDMLYVFRRCKDAFDGADTGKWLESVNVGCRSFLSKSKKQKQKAKSGALFPIPSSQRRKDYQSKDSYSPTPERRNARLALPLLRYLLELKDGVSKGAKVVKKLEEEKSKIKERQSINTNIIVLR